MVLKPDQMSKVTITGPNKIQEDIIKKLHELKILHIIDHSKNDRVDIGSPLEKGNELSEIQVKVRALISKLNIKRENNYNKIYNLKDIDKTTKKLSDDVNLIFDKLKNTEDLIAKSKGLIQTLEILKDIDVPLEAYTQYRSLVYFTGYLKNKTKIKELKKDISDVTDKYNLFESNSKNKTFIVLFIDSSFKESSIEILKKNEFVPIKLLNVDKFKGNAAINLENLIKNYNQLLILRNNIKEDINKLSLDYKKYLLAADDMLTVEIEQAEAPLKFAATKYAFVIKGWIPVKQLEKTIDILNKAGKNKIYVHCEDPDNMDKVPVKLNNPYISKPFEFLINLYTLPNYKEFDPTFFTFLTFPLLFGFMLGDFGYGLITLALFYILKKNFPKAKELFNILIYSSLATIFFGLLFGEFFGSEHLLGIALPHIFSRSHQIILLLWVSLGIGVVHVNSGLIIGFINELHHGFIKAANEKLSWIILQIGAAMLALSYMDILAIPVVIGYYVVALAVFMLFKAEGVKGLVELPSIFSNILSYARLMALGLASVKLAEVVNEFSFEFFHKGGFSIIYGILLLAVGHTINIGLGILGPFLHSLRLHYVEFYTKFFKGGAKKFSPFGARA